MPSPRVALSRHLKGYGLPVLVRSQESSFGVSWRLLCPDEAIDVSVKPEVAVAVAVQSSQQ